MNDIKVISLGGSIIAPEKVDVDFLKRFHLVITDYLDKEANRKLILVCGGGGPAREYQRAFREVTSSLKRPWTDKAAAEGQDWIGIAATRLNAELLKFLFHAYCPEQLVTNPTTVSVFPGRVLVAAGWKPGFSTDYDAVILAEKFQADALINLSNISHVYSADPKEDPDAEALDRISWKDFRKLVGNTWAPGKNVPFDPVASEHAAKIRLRVIVAAGRKIENLKKILTGSDFEGTVIGPD